VPLLEATKGNSGRAFHGYTNDFVAVRNRRLDRLAERNLTLSEQELLINLRTKVMSLFSMPTQEVVQIVRNLITDPDDRIESLLTLRCTDRHTVHHTLNTWHPVNNSLRFAILPNYMRLLHLWIDFLHSVCGLTWDVLAFEAML
jgi:hypothetical protein